MNPYPPEYDDPCVLSIPCDLPEYFERNIYWDEDGTVYLLRDCKEEPHKIVLFSDYESDGNDYDADCEKLRKDVLAKFAVDLDTVKVLSREIEDAWSECQNRPVPDFDEFWDDIKDCVGLTCDEAGDWEPEWCDDCNTWHMRAYCVEYQIDDGERCVVVRNVDQDGDWDTSYYSESEFHWVYRETILTDSYFYKWANYWLWCAQNGGIDPLEDSSKPKPLSVADCLEYAEDNLEYLKMSR